MASSNSSLVITLPGVMYKSCDGSGRKCATPGVKLINHCQIVVCMVYISAGNRLDWPNVNSSTCKDEAQPCKLDWFNLG